jgi:hypothetical protein
MAAMAVASDWFEWKIGVINLTISDFGLDNFSSSGRTTVLKI